MTTLLTILFMCAIGYLAFIFFAETPRPRLRVSGRTISRTLRARHIRGLWIGSLVALSSIAALFVDGGLIDKLKPSLLLAALSALLVAVVFNFTPRGVADWFRNRWDRFLYGDLRSDRRDDLTLQNQSNTPAANDLAMDTTRPLTNDLYVTTDATVQHDSTNSRFAIQQPVTNEHPLDNLTMTQNDIPVVENNEEHEVITSTEQVLVDQANHEVIDPDIAGVFPATGFVHSNQPMAANNGLFERRSSTEHDEIVVDDFFTEVDAKNTTAAEFTTVPAEANEGEHPIELPSDVAESTVELTEPVAPQFATGAQTGFTDESTDDCQSDDPAYVGEAYAGELRHEEQPKPGFVNPIDDSEGLYSDDVATAGIEHADPHASEIDQLAFAMQSVNDDAIKLQQSVVQMNELNQREQYYRTQLHGARLAYEKAQEAEFEAQVVDMSSELELGAKQLQVEHAKRINVEQNLEDKRRALLQAEERVAALENELNARQQVFHDQMESLEKTKEMARNAALLARRAATMQQRARTTALQERAARERLEVSAKKAVDIARNAISKLAEEERKNRTPQNFH